MATMYAIGAALSSVGSWSASSGGSSNGTTPGVGDDVIFDANSPSCSPASNLSCRSFDALNFTNTLTVPAAVTIGIGTTTTNGSLALRLGSGMTLTLGSTTTSVFNFLSSSATQVQITSASKTLGNVTFNGSGGSYLLVDGFSTSASSTVTHTYGTLNTNGQTCSWGVYSSSNSNTRALTLGASSINILATSGITWLILNAANLTFSAGTSTLTFTTGGSAYFGNTALAYNNVVFTPTAAVTTVLEATTSTFANLTYAGANVQGQIFQVLGSFTVTGTFTVNGYGPGVRALVETGNPGSTQTVTTGAYSFSNVDFMDITAAGAGGTWSGTSIGNAGGNSNITFTASRTLYGVSPGNWSASTVWSTSSGGASGQNQPLPQDTVILDNNSATGTYSINVPRLGASLTTTGFTGTLTMPLSSWVYGNVAFGTTGTIALNNGLTLAGRGAQTFTQGNAAISTMTIYAPGGSYTVQDKMTMATNTGQQIVAGAGTLYTNGCPIATGQMTSNTGLTRGINLGSSTVTLGTGGTPLYLNTTASLLTFNAGTSTINFVGPLAAATFYTGGQTFYNVNFTGTVITINAPSSPTFNTVTVGPNTLVNWPAGVTCNIASLVPNGQSNGYQAIPGLSGQNITTPNASPLQLSGSFTIDIHCTVPTQAANWSLCGKWGASGAYSYELVMSSSYHPILRSSTNGTTVVSTTSNGASLTPGALVWIRVSVSAGTASFYTGGDGAWTLYGTALTGVPTSLYNTSADFEIGTLATQYSGDNYPQFNVYEVRLFNSALGAASGATGSVFDANLSTKAFGASTFTESSANAATVTVNGVLAQAGDGRVQFGSSTPGAQATVSQTSGIVRGAYMVLQDSKATGGASFYAGDYSINTSNNSGWAFYNAPASLTAFSSMTIVDQGANVNVSALRSATSSMTLTSSASRSTASSMTAASALTLSSVATRVRSATRSATSSLTLTSSASRGQVFSRSAVSFMSLSSTATKGGMAVSRTAASTLTMTSSASRSSAYARSATSLMPLSSTATISRATTRSATSSLALSSSASRSRSLARSASSSLNLSSTAVRNSVYGRAAASAMYFTTSARSVASSSRLTSSSLGLSSSATSTGGASFIPPLPGAVRTAGRRSSVGVGGGRSVGTRTRR